MTRYIRQDDINPSEVYLIKEATSAFRWVGVVGDDPEWGARLTDLKSEAVSEKWPPIPLEWLPETKGQKIGDFPHFRPNLRCVSRRAGAALERYLKGGGELLELCGLGGMYVGYHCLKEVDALDKIGMKECLARDKYASFHSPRFIPPLLLDNVNNAAAADIFRIPESYAKIFVSGAFKKAYENEGLTGLEFYPVPLAR